LDLLTAQGGVADVAALEVEEPENKRIMRV
jgi:hypothetical protein